MSRFLQGIYAERYGGMTEREVGPFSPGLNVVYGPNEAGKSTLVSLVGGVLFGWDDAHGVRNTYHPERGGRAGALIWADRQGQPAGPRCSLRRVEAGVVGDQAVLDDIDRDTFEAVFSLTSDELRSLKGSSDLTARLFTAGAGTASSPSEAFVEIERRIATSPVYQLEADVEVKQEQVKKASEQAKLHIQEERELHELQASRASTAEKVDALDAELEDLYTWRAELEAHDARAAQLAAERDGLLADLAGLSDRSEARRGETALDARLLALDSAADRVLRDQLDELGEARDKTGRALDLAKENSSASTASYEALCELDDEEVLAGHGLRNRTSQAIVSVLLPLAFIAAGIPLFVHGRDINSLSFTALGVGLVVFAVFLAAAAFAVLFRRPIGAEALENRRKDAQWVMLQDRKKLDACKADQAELEDRIASFLEASGLAGADGSIRQARSLLDEARDVRAVLAEDGQKALSLELRLHAVEKELADADAACSRIYTALSRMDGMRGAAGLAGPVSPDGAGLSSACSSLIREKTVQRDALLEAGEGLNHRLGELEHELALARSDRSFDRVKLEYQQVRTQLRMAKHELISLLLAKRMLERSIVMWESQSQPEVHVRAGRLLSLITDGRWVEVSTSPTGSLLAVDSNGAARDPRHLSLGTCQQLYLALRIALLITAEGVGRAIPVLADDILVNFDSERRLGAARALAELARHRQVIVFTCHEETVGALREAASQLCRVDL